MKLILYCGIFLYLLLLPERNCAQLKNDTKIEVDEPNQATAVVRILSNLERYFPAFFKQERSTFNWQIPKLTQLEPPISNSTKSRTRRDQYGSNRAIQQVDNRLVLHQPNRSRRTVQINQVIALIIKELMNSNGLDNSFALLDLLSTDRGLLPRQLNRFGLIGYSNIFNGLIGFLRTILITLFVVFDPVKASKFLLIAPIVTKKSSLTEYIIHSLIKIINILLAVTINLLQRIHNYLPLPNGFSINNNLLTTMAPLFGVIRGVHPHLIRLSRRSIAGAQYLPNTIPKITGSLKNLYRHYLHLLMMPYGDFVMAIQSLQPFISYTQSSLLKTADKLETGLDRFINNINPNLITARSFVEVIDTVGDYIDRIVQVLKRSRKNLTKTQTEIIAYTVRAGHFLIMFMAKSLVYFSDLSKRLVLFLLGVFPSFSQQFKEIVPTFDLVSKSAREFTKLLPQRDHINAGEIIDSFAKELTEVRHDFLRFGETVATNRIQISSVKDVISCILTGLIKRSKIGGLVIRLITLIFKVITVFLFVLFKFVLLISPILLFKFLLIPGFLTLIKLPFFLILIPLKFLKIFATFFLFFGKWLIIINPTIPIFMKFLILLPLKVILLPLMIILLPLKVLLLPLKVIFLIFKVLLLPLKVILLPLKVILLPLTIILLPLKVILLPLKVLLLLVLKVILLPLMIILLPLKVILLPLKVLLLLPLKVILLPLTIILLPLKIILLPLKVILLPLKVLLLLPLKVILLVLKVILLPVKVIIGPLLFLLLFKMLKNSKIWSLIVKLIYAFLKKPRCFLRKIFNNLPRLLKLILTLIKIIISILKKPLKILFPILFLQLPLWLKIVLLPIGILLLPLKIVTLPLKFSKILPAVIKVLVSSSTLKKLPLIVPFLILPFLLILLPLKLLFLPLTLLILLIKNGFKRILLFPAYLLLSPLKFLFPLWKPTVFPLLLLPLKILTLPIAILFKILSLLLRIIWFIVKLPLLLLCPALANPHIHFGFKIVLLPLEILLLPLRILLLPVNLILLVIKTVFIKLINLLFMFKTNIFPWLLPKPNLCEKARPQFLLSLLLLPLRLLLLPFRIIVFLLPIPIRIVILIIRFILSILNPFRFIGSIKTVLANPLCFILSIFSPILSSKLWIPILSPVFLILSIIPAILKLPILILMGFSFPHWRHLLISLPLRLPVLIIKFLLSPLKILHRAFLIVYGFLLTTIMKLFKVASTPIKVILLILAKIILLPFQLLLIPLFLLSRLIKFIIRLLYNPLLSIWGLLKRKISFRLSPLPTFNSPKGILDFLFRKLKWFLEILKKSLLPLLVVITKIFNPLQLLLLPLSLRFILLPLILIKLL